MRSLALVSCVEQESAAEEEEEAKVQQQPSAVLLRHWTGVAAALVGLSLAAVCLTPLLGYPVLGGVLADNHFSGHADQQSFLGKVSVNSGKIISMDSDHVDCDRYPYFKLVEVRHSNLGGKGPDSGEEGIIYRVRNSLNQELMEMRLNAKSTYEPEILKLNGCAGLEELRGAECGGRFGAFNLKAGTSANLSLSFFDDATKLPKSVKHVAITWFDIDENLAHTNTESISMDGFSKYMLQDPSNVSTKEWHGGTSWSSTSYGDGDNNPVGPEGLTTAQKELSVSVYYDNVSYMDMTTVAGAAGRDDKGIQIRAMGRFFTFALMPCLPCARTLLPALKWEAPEEALEASGAFYKWKKDVGDPVLPGDVIAMTKAGNAIHEISAPPDFLGGFLVARQPFHMGDIMEKRMEAQPIAVLSPKTTAILCAGDSCQELPALHVGNGQVGVDATGIFLGWKVRKGQPVKEGDAVAIANATESGPAVEILAPYPGTVTELQPFKRGDVMEDLIAKQPIAVITSLGTLPLARGDAPVLVPGSSASNWRFRGLEVDVGDAVHTGDILATLTDIDENVVEVLAPSDGYLKSVQLLTEGARVHEVLADGKLAVIREERQRLNPLSKQDPLVPVEADEHALFDKYLVKEGEEVTIGTPIAMVSVPEGGDAPPQRRLLLAHVTGAVWALQGLRKGDKLDEVMVSRDRCVATLMPDAGPTATDPVYTVLAPNNFPELTLFMDWLVTDGSSVRMGDDIARAKLRSGVMTTLKAPASGKVLRVLKELHVGEELQGAGDDITIVTPSKDPVRIKMRLANLPAGSKFNKWHAEVGDKLQSGDKLATVILPNGEVTEVAVYRSGWVAERVAVEPGDFMEGSQELGVLVCPAGVPGSTYYPVDTALLPEGTVFEEFLSTEGAQVREGDGIARVKSVDGQAMTLTAGHDGVVAELAPIYKGDRLVDALPRRVHAIATVIVDPFAAGVTASEAGQRVPAVSTSVSVVPGDLLVQWHKSVGDNISAGDRLATVMRGGVLVEVGSPRGGTVVHKARVDDGDPITESTSSPFAVVEDQQLGYAVRVQGSAAEQGDEFVAWVAQVDDFIKEGDVVCVLRRDNELTRIKAATTGYVVFEESLRPGDKVKTGQDNPLFLVDPMVPPVKEMGVSTQPGNKLLRWEKSMGDSVMKGETVAVVLQDGKELPILAPQDGVVSFEEKNVRVGDPIPVEKSSPLLSVKNLSPLPDKGRGVSTCPEDVFLSWVKYVGDLVTAGAVVARVQRDRWLVELKAPVDGRVVFEQDPKPNLTIGMPMHSPMFMVESPDPFGSTSAGQDAEPGDEFVEWTYSNGDAVKRGAVVAVVHRESELLPIHAPRTGWVTRTASIRSGETLTNESSRPLFSVDDGLFKPPPSGIGQSAAPGDKLLRWHKTKGSEVRKGDLIATLDRDGAEVPLYAPCNGKMSFVQRVVAADSFTQETSNPLFVVMPLEASLPRGMAVNARPGDKFIEWRRSVLDQVGRREIVCLLERHGEVIELVAPTAGHVSFQQDWVPGQMVDSVNNSPAFLVDPRAYGPVGPGVAVLAPDASKLGFAWVRFKSWAINPGDSVQPGDVVAVMELVPPGVQRRLTASAAPKEIQVLSPVTGCVGDVMNLHNGDRLEDHYASRQIASIDECPLPGSLWLLLLFFILACWLCSCSIMARKRRLEEHYSTMKQVTEAAVVASPAKPSFEAPIPITFDFEDLDGEIHSYHFAHRPLGIVYEKGVFPVRVQRCKFNSYARWMGVQDGWAIRKVSRTDVSNKSVQEVEELTKEYLRGKPIWPLRLDFRERLQKGSKAPRTDGDYSQKSISFLAGTQPIGIEFGPRFPIIVSKVFPDTYASDHGIRERWKLVGIGYNDTSSEPLLTLQDPDELDYRDIIRKFRDGVSLLDIRDDNTQILTQTQVRKWEDNLGEEKSAPAAAGHRRPPEQNQRHFDAVGRGGVNFSTRPYDYQSRSMVIR